jgi:hypothetical protein
MKKKSSDSLGGPEIGNPPSKFGRAFAVARNDYG